MVARLKQLSEEEARTLIEEIRWPDGPECPHCASRNGVRLEGRATRAGVFKCRDCGKQFTVTVKTIMHRSKVPLSKWIAAFEVMASRTGGVTARELQRQLGLGSYQTAWQMAHRIRHAMNVGGLRVEPESETAGNEGVEGKPPRASPRKGSGNETLNDDKRLPMIRSQDDSGRVSGAVLRNAIREAVRRDDRANAGRGSS